MSPWSVSSTNSNIMDFDMVLPNKFCRRINTLCVILKIGEWEVQIVCRKTKFTDTHELDLITFNEVFRQSFEPSFLRGSYLTLASRVVGSCSAASALYIGEYSLTQHNSNTVNLRRLCSVNLDLIVLCPRASSINKRVAVDIPIFLHGFPGCGGPLPEMHPVPPQQGISPGE